MAELSIRWSPLGFLTSHEAWNRYRIAELLEPQPDRPAVSPMRSIAVMRRLAARTNERRAEEGAHTVTGGYLFSVGVLHESLRILVSHYCGIQNPGALKRGLGWVEARKGKRVVRQPMKTFGELFPPEDVLRGAAMPSDAGHRRLAEEGEIRESAACEMSLLALAMENPALEAARGLFDDNELRASAPYAIFVSSLERFFENEPIVAKLGKALFECLRMPMRASPNSIEGQIAYIREHWAALLPPELLQQLVLAEDILKEEIRLRGWGAGPAPVLRFRPGRALPVEEDLGYPEPERFSEDVDWMSNVVLIAKSVYVWLDQLSRKYQRHIRRLDQIPDEELDRLARWGFTGLWLIGVWERSPASADVKRRRGNPEAVASAYSIYEYTVAEDLGGEWALLNLRARALERGIRLASDMVPNHVGLYSRWVIEHPDWFLQLDHAPYPGYRFTGPDLSRDSSVGLFIEHGYWDQRDAAVVFKRVDNLSGHVRYIYHGNDGTNTPWNDTAQLNYLVPEVREAVTGAILHVARLFPIIRFDAAMTLTKRHYQRLWFPRPGDGGAVPSRAEHAMTRNEFEAAMPDEFWRDVVVRVAREAPNTLLLAEAFWLMEGYFVRTLGMHRVYNSAFMNMLKMEENINYRTTIRNVLEFSPEVLKRFVNFMNNPDERTAVEQFGKGDKYFGVSTLMVTMPGLPMFGHGQIEGFTEKYGMEYKRAYWDEQVDEDLVRRHEAEIFPLMRNRPLFSGVQDFAFYDFVSSQGHVDENVFAYSNRAGAERSLVLYNNAYNTTSGRIALSAAMNAGDGPPVRKTLGDALGLRADENVYYAFRDHRSRLEFLREGRELVQQGLYAELDVYQCHVFTEFREIVDHDGSWRRLAAHIEGRGVPNVDEARRALVLEPLLKLFREVVNPAALERLADAISEDGARAAAWGQVERPIAKFLTAFHEHRPIVLHMDDVIRSMRDNVAAVQAFVARSPRLSLDDAALEYLIDPAATSDQPSALFWRIALVWALLEPLHRALSDETSAGSDAAWLVEWLLSPIIAGAFVKLGRAECQARDDADLLGILLCFPPPLSAGQTENLSDNLRKMLDDSRVQDYLHVHEFDGVLWVNKEQLESLMYWTPVVSALSVMRDPTVESEDRAERIRRCCHAARQVLTAAEEAGYRYIELIEAGTSRPAFPKPALNGEPDEPCNEA